MILWMALLATQPPLCGGESQAEMNMCARADFERADAELNRVWGEMIAAARAGDAEIDRSWDRRAGSEEVLREAQRAWITFRDAHCTFEGYEARGGSMEPMLVSSCMARLTEDRTRQLRGVSTIVE
jgi:uncharacterized protein YecT (DUF1311 family)